MVADEKMMNSSCLRAEEERNEVTEKSEREKAEMRKKKREREKSIKDRSEIDQTSIISNVLRGSNLGAKVFDAIHRK